MKTGMILYVTEGREQLDDWMDLEGARKRLGIDAVCLATSEAELAYGWWHMFSRGMQHICCAIAAYDPVTATLEATGRRLRLCG